MSEPTHQIVKEMAEMNIRLAEISVQVASFINHQDDHEKRLRDAERQVTNNTQTIGSLAKWLGVIGTATIVATIGIVLGLLEKLIKL